MTQPNKKSVQALQWTGALLKVLDQRQLPETLVYDDYHDAAGVTEAITTMRVRGAPAIGIAAAYGVALSAIRHCAEDPIHWQQKVTADITMLAKSRPTAVNLFWALEQMKSLLNQPITNPPAAFIALAEKIHADDIAANTKMGELGANLLTGAKGVMTHCNTGALATGGYGTALGVIRSAAQRQAIKRLRRRNPSVVTRCKIDSLGVGARWHSRHVTGRLGCCMAYEIRRYRLDHRRR